MMYVIDLLSTMNVGWLPDFANTVGQKCIKMTVVLGPMYIHHDYLQDHSLANPTCFANFKGMEMKEGKVSANLTLKSMCKLCQVSYLSHSATSLTSNLIKRS